MQKLSLSELQWTLTGFNPHEWQLGKSIETGLALSGEIQPIPVEVPGSVQKALLKAGIIPDWNVGVQARQAEWVENRHWLFHTVLPAAWTEGEGKKILHCDGLDYLGQILINGKSIANFNNGFVPHRFDLTEHLLEGDNTLILAFECAPRWLGQFGFTSQIQDLKARFNYFWDWTSRLVQIGIWDHLFLEKSVESIKKLAIRTVCKGNTRGLVVRGERDFAPNRIVQLELYAKGNVQISGTPLHRETFAAHLLERQGYYVDLDLLHDQLELWFPNRQGKPSCYELKILLMDDQENILQEEYRTIGFKEVTWLQNPGCRADADPWWCHVNGQPLFMQGINWTPIRPNFADVTEDHYRELLTSYRDMGFNLLRVWGGAFLEKDCFYDLCDEFGLMVWQEFPLSSSGLDNCPPEDPQTILEWGNIARSYITRRQHHACHIIWCGGNELRQTQDGSHAIPVNMNHPLMQHFSNIVQTLDPDKRFVTSTPSGPSFFATENQRGQGLHWAVNGPWRANGKLEDHWWSYWENDDALLRSETGLPGPSSVELLRKYNDPKQCFPCNNESPIWNRHPWWIEWKQFYEEHQREAENLEEYVTWGQERQRKGLTHAYQCSRNRYPACGGILFWMGHDAFPCAANTSIIDFDGNLKPSGEAIAELIKDFAP